MLITLIRRELLDNLMIFREFIIDTNRADPDSLHIIGTYEGMSKNPISPESIPTFEDTLSLSRDFNTAVIDLLLLRYFSLFFSPEHSWHLYALKFSV